MGLQTETAHCGACSGPMVLRMGIEGAWFRCLDCGEETPPRETVKIADLDVVWTPVARSAPKEQR